MMHEADRIRRLEDEAGRGMVFARGFVLAQDEPGFVPAGWVRASGLRSGVSLWHDARVPCHDAQSGDAGVVVLGDAYSVEAPSATIEEIAAELASLVGRRRAAFVDLLDSLHGRYLVVAQSGKTVRVYHDATAIRSVFHANRGGVAASHAALVALNTGAEPRPIAVAGYGAPGLMTPYLSIDLLPPNQSLELESGRLQRYWPRCGVAQRDLDDVAATTTRLLRSTLQGIRERHPQVLMSLTAGTDSRATLAVALMEGVANDLEFFTYRWNNNKWIDRADQRIASQIAGDLALQHSFISLDEEPPVSETLERVLGLNTYRTHFRMLASAYSRRYGHREVVHLRSNLSEIMRTFYLKKLPTSVPRSGADLAEIYRRSIRKGEEPSPDDWRRAVREFEHMYRATGFRRASGRVDGRDLMYWEHRMGAWHGQVVLESDIAFETLSLYNSRAVISTMLGAAIDQRMDDAHMYRIIAMAPFDLMQYRFNPGPKRVMSGRTGADVLAEDASAIGPRWPGWLPSTRVGRG
jgi:hypothetical protein